MNLLNNYDVRRCNPVTKSKIALKMSAIEILNGLQVWRDGENFIVWMEYEGMHTEFLNRLDYKNMLMLLIKVCNQCPCKMEKALDVYPFKPFDKNLWGFVDGY